LPQYNVRFERGNYKDSWNMWEGSLQKHICIDWIAAIGDSVIVPPTSSLLRRWDTLSNDEVVYLHMVYIVGKHRKNLAHMSHEKRHLGYYSNTSAISA